MHEAEGEQTFQGLTVRRNFCRKDEAISGVRAV